MNRYKKNRSYIHQVINVGLLKKKKTINIGKILNSHLKRSEDEPVLNRVK